MRQLLSALTFTALMCLAAPARAEPAMWVVRDADSVIVLFGSVHVLPKDTPWRSPRLDAALAGADDLWFETPVDPVSMGRVSRSAADRGTLGPRGSLWAMLSPATQARLDRVVLQLDLSPAAIDHMEPWLADLAITFAAVSRSGAVSDEGVDRRIEATTPPGVKRRAFESGDQQVAIFDRSSRAVQIAALETTLSEVETEPGLYRDLVDAWLSGDSERLNSLGNARLQAHSPSLYRRLVVERNARWTKIIRKRLAGHGATVMVVGAGHLVGPDSVPARLRAMGVSVEGP